MNGYKRPHHCLFAFRVLPSYFFADPSFAEALSQDTGGALGRLWDDFGKAIAEKGEEQIETPPTVHKLVDDERRCFVVIKMPEPLHSPEAHLIGLLYERPKKVLFWKTKPLGRYFTLEKAPGLMQSLHAAGALQILCPPNDTDTSEATGDNLLKALVEGPYELRDANGNLIQDDGTFLCEIRADGSRENHGEGPKSTFDEFWKAVTEHL